MGKANYDRTGWSEATGTTCHKTLKGYVNSLPEDEVRTLREQTNRIVNSAERQPHKIPHYVNTGMYCTARLTYGKA